MSIDKPGKDMERTTNPGDRISDEPQTIEEKAKQLAVDHVPDITGDVVINSITYAGWSFDVNVSGKAAG